MILDEIRLEVSSACNRAENVLTPAFFDEHLALVARWAGELAPALAADAEVVQLAAWLHDLSAVHNFDTLPRHAAASADLAGQLLSRHGYPAERLARVCEAVSKHSRPLTADEGSPEAVCLSQADAMAQISRPTYWLFFAFRLLKLDYAAGKRWYADRVRQNWEALIPEAQELVRTEYERALAILA